MNKFLSNVFALLVATATTMTLAQEIKGNPAAGEKKNAMCIGCHGIVGYQTAFPAIYRVPMISGQNEKYIISALSAYQKGDRKHPSMRAIAASLSDQDMADLAAYYSTNGKVAGAEVPPAGVPAATGGAAKFILNGNCTSCHGANFNTPTDPSIPKLAGQHKDYLQFALPAYLEGASPQLSRGQATMGGMVNKIRADLVKSKGAVQGAREFADQYKEAMAYIASLPSELKTVPEARFRTSK